MASIMAETENTPQAQKKHIRNIAGKVIKCEKETSDTYTLFIEVSENNKDYQAGQFLSIDPHQFEELKDQVQLYEQKKGHKEVVRAYSMASSPMDDYITITIKPEEHLEGVSDYEPLLSPLLASDKLMGRQINFLGYTGPYVLPVDHAEHTKEVLHLVAGSGIVPNYSILRDQLIYNKNPSVTHTMIYVNKTHEDIIFRQQLEDLAKTYGTRFRLIHLLTRDNHRDHGPNFHKGRPTISFVREYVNDPERVLVFACGAAISKWQRRKARETGIEPAPRFMEAAGEIVKELGVDKKRYKHESYG